MELTEYDHSIIAKNLSPDIAALADRYPADVLNAAIWCFRPLPSIKPKNVEFWALQYLIC